MTTTKSPKAGERTKTLYTIYDNKNGLAVAALPWKLAHRIYGKNPSAYTATYVAKGGKEKVRWLCSQLLADPSETKAALSALRAARDGRQCRAEMIRGQIIPREPLTCENHDFCLVDDEGTTRCSKCGQIDPSELE